MLLLRNISLINIGHICILYYNAAGHDRSDDELRQFPYLSGQPSVNEGRCARARLRACTCDMNKRVT